MSLQITNNQAKHRFETEVDGQVAVAEYRRRGETIIFTHTEVPAGLTGRGVGAQLVRGALDQAREAGWRVVPACRFVASFIEKHPEYQNLVGEDLG